MGSLLTALASFVDIKSRGGHWFVRIDDIDPPRYDPAAEHSILASLAAHGLISDRPIDYQSAHEVRYASAYEQLRPYLYFCSCSRKDLQGHAIYPGTCRSNREPAAETVARIFVDDQRVQLEDALRGTHEFMLAELTGDFIVRRRDGLWSYNFATAVDDGNDVTHVMRGADLYETTGAQLYLMEALGLAAPTYAHVPVLCFADGTKLSKQTHAPPLANEHAPRNLWQALTLLGQRPPARQTWPTSQWLAWAVDNWNPARIPDSLPPFRLPSEGS